MLENSSKGWRMRKACLIVLFISAALCSASAIASKSKTELPEVSSDGLHLLKDTKVAIAYAKPGATLEPYTRIKILDAFVDFKKDWQRDYNMEEIGLSGRVSDKDAEAIKAGLAAEFKKIFTEELTKKGHEIVDDVGPDVLLLRPALINVDVTAPDTMSSGMGRTWIQSAGQMTLYLEFYDSATSTLLARVIDPQGDREGLAQPASRVTNKAAADRILREWADLLATHLGEVKSETKAN